MNEQPCVNQILVYAPIDKYGEPVSATKHLSIDNEGTKHKSSYTNSSVGYLKTLKFETFDELATILANQASRPMEYLLRAGLREHIDLSKPQYRRKLLENYPGQESTVSLQETPLSWVILDVDHLKITTDICQADITEIILDIFDTYAPELSNTSFIAQLSSGCGWKDKDEINCHLAILLDKPALNVDIKKWVTSINNRADFKVFDPALCSASQPIYIANPTFDNPDNDPFPTNRIVVYKGAKDKVSIDFEALPTAKPIRTKKGKTTVVSSKQGVYQQHHHSTYLEWYNAAKVVEGDLNIFALHLAQWIAHNRPFGMSKKEQSKLYKAVKQSPRIRSDSGRYDEFVAEMDRLESTARQNHLRQITQLFTDAKPIPDIIETSKWVSCEVSDKLMLLDAPCGTGKTTWIKDTFYQGRITSSLYISSVRALAKAAAAGISVLKDYEDVKNKSWKWLTANPTYQVDHLSVCLNSLLNGKIKHVLKEEYDLLCIDEIEHTLVSIFNGVLPKEDREAIFMTLMLLMSNAKSVVLAQHNIGKFTLKFLEFFGFNREDIVILKNTTRRYQDLPCSYFQNESALLAKVHNAILAKTPFFLASDSKTKIDTIAQGIRKKFGDLRILKVTADTLQDAEVINLLSNPDLVSKQYVGILASPALSHGFNLQNPDYKRTFGFFTSTPGLPAAGCVQMLFRARAVSEINYHVDPVVMPKVSVDYVAAALSNRQFNAKDYIREGDELTIKLCGDDLKILDLHASILEKDDDENVRFYESLLVELEDMIGCRVKLNREDVKEDFKVLKKESKEIVKTQAAIDILTAEKITLATYMDMKSNPLIHEKACRERFILERCMRIDIDEYPVILSSDDIVKTFELYTAANPILIANFDDYDEGHIKKPHLFLSEAAVSGEDRNWYANALAQKWDEKTTVYLDEKIKDSFYIRSCLFQILLPLVQLVAVENQVVPVSEGVFTYQEVLRDSRFLAFCAKNKESLQGCSLPKFRVAPNLAYIGNLLTSLGLKPANVRCRTGDKRVYQKQWTTFDFPVTRLLAKYNAIADEIVRLQSVTTEKTP